MLYHLSDSVYHHVLNDKIFKNNTFLKEYNTRKSCIIDTTYIKADASYWFLNNSSSKNTHWELQSYLHDVHWATLLEIFIMLKNALKETLNIKCENFTPGFIMTKSYEHQMLHVDSKKAFDDKEETYAIIVHIPLSEKVMWFWVGSVQNTKFCDELVHLPFGSGIILSNQWVS